MSAASCAACGISKLPGRPERAPLIGNNATVQDGAVIGPKTLVGAGATVAPGTEVAEGIVLLGAAAKREMPMSDGARWWVDNNPTAYQRLARRHRDGIAPVG